MIIIIVVVTVPDRGVSAAVFTDTFGWKRIPCASINLGPLPWPVSKYVEWNAGAS